MKLSHATRLARDIASFARENKKWWLIPLVCGLVVLAALVVLSQTPASPFIYVFF